MNAERVEFGRHKGTLWTRVPVSYLTWMVNAKHPLAERARAELDRRGTETPTLDVTLHAIDRASLRILDRWQRSHHPNFGFGSWLHKQAAFALADGKRIDANRIDYAGIRFVFEDLTTTEWPVLKSVMLVGERE